MLWLSEGLAGLGDVWMGRARIWAGVGGLCQRRFIRMSAGLCGAGTVRGWHVVSTWLLDACRIEVREARGT